MRFGLTEDIYEKIKEITKKIINIDLKYLVQEQKIHIKKHQI